MPHTVTRGANCTADGGFDSGTINPGSRWGRTFTKSDPGTQEYFCRYHCASEGMIGKLTVALPTPSEEGTWGKIKDLYR